jgi:fucose permease
MLLLSVAVQTVGAVLVIIGFGDVLMTIIGTLVIGVGAAPVYGTVISVATGAFPSAPGRAASFAAALGSLGGLTITPLQGVVIERLGPALNGWYLLILCVVMLVCFALIRALVQRRVPVAA